MFCTIRDLTNKAINIPVHEDFLPNVRNRTKQNPQELWRHGDVVHTWTQKATPAGSYTFCAVPTTTLPVFTWARGIWRVSKLAEATDIQSHFVSSNLETH